MTAMAFQPIICRKTGVAVLDGEESDNTVFWGHQTTGNGILTALKLCEVMAPDSYGYKIFELFEIEEDFQSYLHALEQAVIDTDKLGTAKN